MNKQNQLEESNYQQDTLILQNSIDSARGTTSSARTLKIAFLVVVFCWIITLLTVYYHQSELTQHKTIKLQASKQINAESIHTQQKPDNRFELSQKNDESMHTQQKQENRFQWAQKMLHSTNAADLQRLYKEEYNYYEDLYHISKHKQQTRFCVIVPTYQNAKQNRHIENIKSILNQNYSNYHVVFVDDASNDGTGKDVQNFVKQNYNFTKEQVRYTISHFEDDPSKNMQIRAREKIHFIHNVKNRRAMFNIRRASNYSCGCDQVVVVIDGDDRLLGKQVFKFYNSVYLSEKVYVFYTQFITTEMKLGFSSPFPEHVLANGGLRNYIKQNRMPVSHLRSFKNKLFRAVKDEHLRDQRVFGSPYFSAANDLAIMTPVIQMSGKRVTHHPEITYLYSDSTGNNNHAKRRSAQLKNRAHILDDFRPYNATSSWEAIPALC